MEGQILGNRYELIEKIGGGGMALVYKAKCNLLNRFVAVKILRPEFINDEEFVKRFKVEAQSAASLSYPNIVSIYDVGHQDDIHYIVMEYVDGVTLKEYISKNGALGWREAVNIELQIASAIEHAHKNRIVHRDIKPHNILITGDGIVKVTDFGIARAVSSSTLTMVGSTIGSVHYFSPEQARGGFTDEKSDLYSLGIALYEMVTGRVPFDGDTPVAVALKHLQVEAEPPINFKKDIPLGINDIVMNAIQKDQTKRYQSATDLLNDLNMVLIDPSWRMETKSDIESSPTKRIQVVVPDETKRVETTYDNYINDTKQNDINTGYKKNPNVQLNETLKEESDEDMKDKKKDRLTWVLAIATSAIIIGIFIFFAIKLFLPIPGGNGSTKKEITLEDYSGKNVEDVTTMLRDKGITVKIKQKNDKEVDEDLIISQEPNAGEVIKPDSYNPVTLYVSKGPEMIKVPDLKNYDLREAQRQITDYGLVSKIEEEFSEEVNAGNVVRTSPAFDEEVEPGATITLYKSKGPEILMTVVPDLTGTTRVQAQKILTAAKLTLGKVLPEDSANNVDRIVSQNPAPNTSVKEQSPVEITLNTVKPTEVVATSTPKPVEVKTKSVQRNIELNNAESFGDTIKVVIEATQSDTNKTIALMDATRNKQDFPLTIDIPVPEGGRTYVKVYVEGVQNSELIVE